jgi:NAD(P)-dependent dehydrogenase (short-subunit alcohol dehydrogenase family)
VTDELEPARSEQTASEVAALAVILGRVHLATGALLTSGVVMRARAGQRLGNQCTVLENGVLVGQAAHSRPRVGWVTRGSKGPFDIVCANAGILSTGSAWELSEEAWQEVIDVNLTGVWKTVKAAIPQLIEQGHGGSIILTSSIAGLVAFANLAHYTAAKHGVTGLMRTLAVELAPHRIRVNSVHPTTVDTDMVQNGAIYQLFLGAKEASRADAEAGMKALNALPIPWVDPVDVSNAVLFLASDESRYITGTTQVIDAGALAPFKIPHE